MRRYYTPIRAAASLIRPDALLPPRSQFRAFRTIRALHRSHDGAGAQDHYATLKVAPNASPSEIKKSFYALSKAHHPDHNPNDPTATTKFHAISDAYATLGTPAKRAAGMGPGQDPYGHRREGQVPHFDREGHTRTQSAQDSRRRTRMEGQGVMPSGSGDSAVGLFFAISGILFLTFFLPYVFFGGLTQGRRRKKDVEKSRSKTA
ncbi:Beta-glucosidase B [Verticillium dahliae VDG2]|nr:Beta-glucosidase B [Verticillium dahliae VDG2]